MITSLNFGRKKESGKQRKDKFPVYTNSEIRKANSEQRRKHEKLTGEENEI